MAFRHMNEEQVPLTLTEQQHFLRDTFTFVFMQRAVLDQEDLGKGDRIATFMFYVSRILDFIALSKLII